MAKKSTKTTAEPTGWTYNGKPGTFVPGLPPRYVSLAQAKRLDIVQALQASSLYSAEYAGGSSEVEDTED